MSIIESKDAPEPVGLYPHARKVGNLLFLSGIGPRKKGEKDIPGVELDKNGESSFSGPWAHSRQFSQAGTPKRSGNKPKMTRKCIKKCSETKPFAGGQNAQNHLFPCVSMHSGRPTDSKK